MYGWRINYDGWGLKNKFSFRFFFLLRLINFKDEFIYFLWVDFLEGANLEAEVKLN